MGGNLHKVPMWKACAKHYFTITTTLCVKKKISQKVDKSQCTQAAKSKNKKTPFYCWCLSLQQSDKLVKGLIWTKMIANNLYKAKNNPF